jgi:hypothetical protein
MQGNAMNKQLECPYCETKEIENSTSCPSCQRSLVVGQLESLGTGVLPKGTVWDLLPMLLKVGRDKAKNDFVIDSNLVGKRHADFRFGERGFVLKNATPDVQCLVNGRPVTKDGMSVASGDRVKIGVEDFAFHFLYTDDPPPVPAAEMESESEAAGDDDSVASESAVSDFAVDAVLETLIAERKGADSATTWSQAADLDDNLQAVAEYEPSGELQVLVPTQPEFAEPEPPELESTPEPEPAPTPDSVPKLESLPLVEPEAKVGTAPASPSDWSAGVREQDELVKARRQQQEVERQIRLHEKKIDGLFLLITDLMTQVASSGNLPDVMALALDAIIAVSKMGRGIGYLVEADEAEVGIKEVAARVAGGGNLTQDSKAHSYSINQHMLELSFTKKYPIVCTNPFSEDMIDTQRVGYQAVLCLPLMTYNAHTGQQEVRGMIYADALHVVKNVDKYLDTILSIVSNGLIMAIFRHDVTQSVTLGGGLRGRLMPLHDRLASTEEMALRFSNEIDQDTDLAADVKVVLYHQVYEITSTLGDARKELQLLMDQ